MPQQNIEEMQGQSNPTTSYIQTMQLLSKARKDERQHIQNRL